MLTMFAVLLSSGPHRTVVYANSPTAKAAEREACGIVEAGGDVWETEDGLLPDDDGAIMYDVDGVIRADLFPEALELVSPV